MYALEREPGVLNVRPADGFPYGDVPSIGAHVVVATDNDPAKARELARSLRDQFFDMRNAVGAEYHSVEAALDLAVADGRAPITIADTADNTGGGAPGDSTFFLRALIDRRIANVALGPLYDPIAVSICQDGGIGAHLRLRIGGKLGPESGAPVDVDCTVIGLSNRVVETLNGGPSSLGACAAIRIPIDGDCIRRRHRGDADRTPRASGLTRIVQRRGYRPVDETHHRGEVDAALSRRFRTDLRARHLHRRPGCAGGRRTQHPVSQREDVRLLAVQPSPNFDD